MLHRGTAGRWTVTRNRRCGSGTHPCPAAIPAGPVRRRAGWPLWIRFGPAWIFLVRFAGAIPIVLQQQVPRVWPGDPFDLGTRVLRDRLGSSGESILPVRPRAGRYAPAGVAAGAARPRSRVITSVTVVTSSADAAPAVMIGVVLIVAMRSGYWPVADRHSLRGEALRDAATDQTGPGPEQ